MEIKRSENLCNFYILPLLGFNKLSFGGAGNFINSYISKDGKYVIVEVKAAKSAFDEHKNYVTDFTTNNKLTIVFSIPLEFEEEILRFKAGKYSQFSARTKQIIKDKSGLRWKVATSSGKTSTARELLALDKDEDLRKVLEEEIGVRISEDAELASIPSDNNFYELSLSTISQSHA